jgi:hypothetical protein
MDNVAMEYLERLHTLADKALNKTVTIEELKEFNQLITEWEAPTELDLTDKNFSQQLTQKR